MQDAIQTGVLRLPDVIRLVGLSRSSIYALMQQGRFPKQVLLSLRAVGWRHADIEAWLESRSVAGGKEGA